MTLTQEQIKYIEEAFGIINGAWTREAVSYVGLKHPLKAGWKHRLMAEGIPKHAPIANGVNVADHLWLCGRDVSAPDMLEEQEAHESARFKNEHMYVMSQLEALEAAISDLRKQADDLRTQVRELRNSVSEDDF